MTSKIAPIPHMLRHWREAVPDDRLAHLIRDVSRAQMRALHARLIVHGVSFGHWTFLRILWLQDGLTQRELSHLAGVMEPTTLTAVRTMQGMGMVERRQLEGNRKNMHVFLTESGRALEKVLVPLAEDVNRISVGELNERHVATTRRVLLGMLENLAQDPLLSETTDSPSTPL
jgi:DNA-binding MarR family transcriptional regulator